MTIYEHLVRLEHEGVPLVLVTLVDALGSTPQDAAAKMLVMADGLYGGTVGGGKVEAAALRLAHELLEKRDAKPRFVTWTLKGDVGMTCGGSVKFYFEPHFGPGPWGIAVFGAGHVARIVLSATEGFIDRQPTIESIAAHEAEILGSPLIPIENDFDRMMEGFTG